jgi:cellulose synthase operon protein C
MRYGTHLSRLAQILVVGALCTLALSARAVPIQAGGRAIASAQAPDESPQGREHRAGIQALVDGNIPTAKKHFEASLTIDPQYVPSLIGLASVTQSEGKSAEAEQYLQRADRAAPQSPAVHLAWGRYYLAGKQLDQAEKSFLEARRVDSKVIPPLLELGDLYLRVGRPADALKLYRDAVFMDSTNKYAQYGLGVSAAANGKRDEALNAFEVAANLAPRDPAPLRAAGLVHMETGAFDRAIASFDKGLLRQPQYVPLMLDRADALVGQKRWNEALKQLELAEKLAPNSGQIQLKFADVNQSAEQWSEAESRYLKAIKFEPNSASAFNNLAWMTVARAGNSKKAVEWARKAVALSPGSSPFLDTLGWALHAAGDLQAALERLQQAIKLEPKVANYHFHLGVVQIELKQPVAARESLKLALGLDPKMPQADEAKRLLKSLL